MPDPERFHDDNSDFSKIALSESDVREAARLFRVLAGAISDRPSGDEDRALGRHDRIERARTILNSRRVRAKYFSPSMFGEPAWDILLVLYVTEMEGRHSIGRLAEWIETPLSTAVRWLDYLERKLLVEREPHPTDKRVVFIKLAEKGRRILDDYLAGAPWDPDNVGGI